MKTAVFCELEIASFGIFRAKDDVSFVELAAMADEDGSLESCCEAHGMRWVQAVPTGPMQSSAAGSARIAKTHAKKVTAKRTVANFTKITS
mmetsp:Transcript_44463/g.103887  ORF Transcript_44463/g.103887 Transcript_44463/m.103887 type:complete len:91 (+) Transcript_44463:147-419(+)